jgi:prolyl oligopeptidase PreP (S9A serine peptidase family)
MQGNQEVSSNGSRLTDAVTALAGLSCGGANASVVREFAMTTRQFVNDGFHLPKANNDNSRGDENTVQVRTDFGEGCNPALPPAAVESMPLVHRRHPMPDQHPHPKSPSGAAAG